ncbi:MAG: hypothetical protein JEZ07_00615 [Phycisphaerae bacterium]|nr:hypothetical protein [Phycisphaerae bacterium]
MVGKLDQISKSVDFRKMQLAEYDIIMNRMKLLAPPDRIILELHLSHNASFSQLGILIGITPANISRKIRKMVKRLLSDDYMCFLRNRNQFTDNQLLIAYDHFLLGQGRRTIALKRKISVSTVYRQLCYLDEWLIKHKARNEHKNLNEKSARFAGCC